METEMTAEDIILEGINPTLLDAETFNAALRCTVDQNKLLIDIINEQRSVIEAQREELEFMDETIDELLNCKENGKSFDTIVKLRKAVAFAEYTAGLRKTPIHKREK